MFSRLANVLHITPAERAALQLLAIGKATREIALSLGVVESDVDAELSALFRRMGARSRAEAVATAGRRGLLTPDARHPPKDSGNARTERVGIETASSGTLNETAAPMPRRPMISVVDSGITE